jgi:hypothetical protein
MRFKLVCFLLVFGLAAPVLAQNYPYIPNQQPAPQYRYYPPQQPRFNLPQNAPQYLPQNQLPQNAPQQSRPDPVFVGKIEADDENIPNNQNQNPKFGMSLNEALSCTASIQIVSLSAPNWARDEGVVNSSNLWLGKTFEIAEKTKVGGDKVNALLKTEMDKQTKENSNNLDALSQRAFLCAANPPI